MNNSVYIQNSNSVSKINRNFLISIVPAILFYIFNNGVIPFIKDNSFITLIYPIIFILSGLFSSILFDIFYSKIFLKKLKIKYNSVILGLILCLILPIKTPIFLLMIAIFLTSIFKIVLKKDNYNPVLIGYLIIFVIYLRNIYIINTNPIKDYLDFIKKSENLVNYFFGLSNYISPFICILSLCFLVYKRAIKWKIPIISITTSFIISLLIGNIYNLKIDFALFYIFSNYFLFFIVFIASNNITTPVTSIGQIIYAILLSILTIFFDFLTPISNGIFISILVLNLLGDIIDILVSISDMALKKIFIPLIFCIIITLLVIKLVDKKIDIYNLHFSEAYNLYNP